MSLARNIKQVFRKEEEILIDVVVPNTSPQLFVAHIVGGANYHFCQSLIGQEPVKVGAIYTVGVDGVLRVTPKKKKNKK